MSFDIFRIASGGCRALSSLDLSRRCLSLASQPMAESPSGLDHAAGSFRAPQALPFLFRFRFPRLGLLRSFARRVFAAAVSLVLICNLFVSPRRYSYAIAPALPVLAAGLGLADFAAIGLASIATFALGVTGLQGLDLTARDALIESMTGSDAVPANREFFDNAYATYQQTGSFGVSAADVPDSVLSAVVDAYEPVLASSVSLRDVVMDTAGMSASIAAVNGISYPSTYTSRVPYCISVRSVKPSTGDVIYCFLYVMCCAKDGESLAASVGTYSDRAYLFLNGKGAYAASARAYGTREACRIQLNYNGSYTISNAAGSYYWDSSEYTYNNRSTIALGLNGYTDYTVLGVSNSGFVFGPESVSDVPEVVSSVYDGVAAGTLSGGQAIADLKDAFGDMTLAFNDAIASYNDVLLEGSGSGEGEGEIDPDAGVLAQILAALGISGPIVTVLNGIVSGISAIPTQLANLLFNTHIQSFSQTAIDSLDDILSQYVSSLPAWLQETGTVLDGLPSNIALAMDGNFGDVITAVNQVLEQVTGIPAEIPEAFGTIITGIPAEVWGEFEGPIGDIIDVLDGVLDGVLGIPRAITDAGASVVTGIGDLTLDVDLSGVLSAIGAIPLSISAALGLDWVIDQAQDLDERMDWDEPDALLLPSATWDEAVAVAEDFGDLTPLGPMEDFINGVFDVFAGNGGNRRAGAPRYTIEFPNPWGSPFTFTVDFSIFDGAFVSLCHAVFYLCFGFWYFGFVRKLKDSADSYIGELMAARGVEA